MIKVQFNHKYNYTLILAKDEDKMGEICSKFIQKTGNDKNNFYYLYSGNMINPELSVSQTINQVDKDRNIMNLLVFEMDFQDQNVIINLKYIL